MSQKWFNNIDLQQNELQNGVIQNLAADPTSGKAGQIYYNTVDKGYRYHNGTAWVSITAEAVKSIVAGDGLTGGGTGTVTINLGTPSASGSGSNTYGSNSVTDDSHTHQIKLPDASESAKGVIELATDAEAETGKDTTRAINAKQLAKAKQSAIDSAKVTIQTSNGITGGSITPGNSFTLSGVNASTEAKGVVELATDAEATAGTDTTRAINAKQLEAARKNAEVAVTAGNGLTGGGTGHSLSIAMGTPSTITQSTINQVMTNSHTHGLSFREVASPATSGNEISFIDTVSQGVDGGISATKKTVRSASTTQTGVVQLATQDEVNNGTDTKKVITPTTLGKGKASGVASLDANSKIIASQLPDYLLGQVMYGGNASTVATTTTVSPSDSLKAKKNITATSISIANSATSAAANTYGWQDLEGVYFICQANGTFAEISFETGDWIISTGSKWEKIDNTDAVKSVNGQTGNVNITRVNEAGTADRVANALFIGAATPDNPTMTKWSSFTGRDGLEVGFEEGEFLGDETVSHGVDYTIYKRYIKLSPTGVTAGTYNNVTVDAKGRVVSASNIKTSVVSEITGNGTQKEFNITHSLGKNVIVQVFLNGQQIGSDTADELVGVDVYTTAEKVKLVFATAPSTSQKFKVVISSGGNGVESLTPTAADDNKVAIADSTAATGWKFGKIKTENLENGKVEKANRAEISEKALSFEPSDWQTDISGLRAQIQSAGTYHIKCAALNLDFGIVYYSGPHTDSTDHSNIVNGPSIIDFSLFSQQIMYVYTLYISYSGALQIYKYTINNGAIAGSREFIEQPFEYRRIWN